MVDLDLVSRLVQQTMGDFDRPGTTVAGMVRQCIRIASLRGDAVNLMWLEMEAMDLGSLTSEDLATTSRPSASSRFLARMDPAEASQQFSVEYQAFLRRRRLVPTSAEMTGASVEQLESMIENVREQEELLSGQTRRALFLSRMNLTGVLNRVKARLWEFLNETETELAFGEASAETFDRLRQYVDQQLSTLSQLALDQFQTAYRRLQDGGDEDRAHALTSCRRVLKTLADAVYPASAPVVGRDGVQRLMTDDKFMNRLLQYVSDTVGKRGNGAVVQAALEQLGSRLATLNDLASKGVHADVTGYEVDTCVVQTYLLVADVLRVRERAIPEG